MGTESFFISVYEGHRYRYREKQLRSKFLDNTEDGDQKITVKGVEVTDRNIGSRDGY